MNLKISPAHTVSENTGSSTVRWREQQYPPWEKKDDPAKLQAIVLTREQEQAIEIVLEALKNDKVTVALSGPAGSGKTTLISKLKEKLGDLATVSAMTNKAVEVLRQKGLAEAITTYKACLSPVFREPGKSLLTYFSVNDEICAPLELELHEIFEAGKLSNAKDIAKQWGAFAGARKLGIKDFFEEYFVQWSPQPTYPEAILIIDEASMLGADLLKLVRKCYSKIVLIGDENQLSPVKDKQIFFNKQYNDVRHSLSEIHRQESWSQPLLLASQLKQQRRISYDPVVPIDIELCRKGVPIIVWRNSLRIALTKLIRTALGYHSTFPQPGEIVVCKENHIQDEVEFVNNSLWKVVSTNLQGECELLKLSGQMKISKPIKLAMDEYEEVEGLNFRFGYVLTCHTAQGSEWDCVMIHAKDADDCLSAISGSHIGLPDGFKWLYTAVTRAKGKVIFVE